MRSWQEDTEEEPDNNMKTYKQLENQTLTNSGGLEGLTARHLNSIIIDVRFENQHRNRHYTIQRTYSETYNKMQLFPVRQETFETNDGPVRTRSTTKTDGYDHKTTQQMTRIDENYLQRAFEHHKKSQKWSWRWLLHSNLNTTGCNNVYDITINVIDTPRDHLATLFTEATKTSIIDITSILTVKEAIGQTEWIQKEKKKLG